MTEDQRSKVGVWPVILIALSCVVLLKVGQQIAFAWAYDQLRCVNWKSEASLCAWPCVSIALSIPPLVYLRKIPRT